LSNFKEVPKPFEGQYVHRMKQTRNERKEMLKAKKTFLIACSGGLEIIYMHYTWILKVKPAEEPF
jgi:hypothetical protein